MKWKQLIQQEAVLTAAILLAAVSAFIIPPDSQYIGYIDFETLAVLFSLMTVLAGFRNQGVFDRIGRALVARSGKMLIIVLMLVGLCFFGSMLITNDVALVTFVQFTFAVLGGLGTETKAKITLPVVCMQTIAANLGSTLTPIGNPQNFFLYSKSGMSIVHFMGIMLPYATLAMVMLILWGIWFCRGKKQQILLQDGTDENCCPGDKRIIALYIALFVCCLLTVVHVLPYGLVLAAVLMCTLIADCKALCRVDYSLLLTFVALFIFIGNLGRISVFSTWIQGMLVGREVQVAVFASQITSNVPAALLLSSFTDNIEALIIGTNLGGLGTLIASMASLISYRQVAIEMPADKGRYFKIFSISNIVFLIILLVEWALLGI